MGVLTSWSTRRVTTPLGFTRAVTFNVTPLLRVEMVLANSDEPLEVAVVAADDDKVGTSWPTFMTAGMLSVASSTGAEITLVLPLVSWAVRMPRSSRLRPTSAPAVSTRPVEVAAACACGSSDRPRWSSCPARFRRPAVSKR